MFRNKAKVAIILGAGFSKNASIPLQSEFSNMILSINSNTLDVAITNAIKDFLEKVYFWEEGNGLPTLEDMFTMIDLSSATGHNLGRSLLLTFSIFNNVVSPI